MKHPCPQTSTFEVQKKASSTPVQIRELLNKIRIPANERIWGAKKVLRTLVQIEALNEKLWLREPTCTKMKHMRLQRSTFEVEKKISSTLV